jgi:hypothetical protein
VRKQFIVCGASTGGKTTFSHAMVRRYGLTHVPIDPIIEGFEDVFPHLGITHNANTHERHIEVCQSFKPFLFRMINGLDDYDFLVEDFRIPLADLVEIFGHNHEIYVFGFPRIKPEQKLALCRKYDLENWTTVMMDEDLLPVLQFLVEESRFLESECVRLGVPFFDTGKDYPGELGRALSMAAARIQE